MLRQRIGKELISLGIDNANYGINSTAGEGEASHPYVTAQLAAHNSVGKYASGLVVHGGSGGGGIVTLDNSLHNEFSHEVGHNICFCDFDNRAPHGIPSALVGIHRFRHWSGVVTGHHQFCVDRFAVSVVGVPGQRLSARHRISPNISSWLTASSTILPV